MDGVVNVVNMTINVNNGFHFSKDEEECTTRKCVFIKKPKTPFT